MSVTAKRVLPVLSLSIFSNTLGVGIVVPLLPLYVEKMGATGVWLGLIIGIFSVSRLIASPFAGRLSDRAGRKLIMAIGLLIFAVNSLGYVWATNLPALVIVRLLHGVASGTVLPAVQAYIGDVAPKGEEGRWMGYFNAAFMTGFGAGPLMGGIMTDHLGMNAGFYAMGALSLLSALGVIFFIPEIKGRKNTASAGSSFKDIAASKTMRGIFSFQMSNSAYRGIFTTFFPVFAGIKLGLSTSLIGILLTVQILGSSLLQLPGGKLADKLNKTALVVIGCAACLIAMALIPSASNFWLLLALCLVLGLGDASAVPAASAMTIDEGRKFGMGTAMAVLNIAMSIGIGLGPILGGAIVDMSGINFAFYFAAVMLLAGTVAFSWFTR